MKRRNLGVAKELWDVLLFKHTRLMHLNAIPVCREAKDVVVSGCFHFRQDAVQLVRKGFVHLSLLSFLGETRVFAWTCEGTPGVVLTGGGCLRLFCY